MIVGGFRAFTDIHAQIYRRVPPRGIVSDGKHYIDAAFLKSVEKQLVEFSARIPHSAPTDIPIRIVNPSVNIGNEYGKLQLRLCFESCEILETGKGSGQAFDVGLATIEDNAVRQKVLEYTQLNLRGDDVVPSVGDRLSPKSPRKYAPSRPCSAVDVEEDIPQEQLQAHIPSSGGRDGSTTPPNLTKSPAVFTKKAGRSDQTGTGLRRGALEKGVEYDGPTPNQPLAPEEIQNRDGVASKSNSALGASAPPEQSPAPQLPDGLLLHFRRWRQEAQAGKYVRRRVQKIEEEQSKLLESDESWHPALIGHPARPGQVPLMLLELLSAAADKKSAAATAVSGRDSGSECSEKEIAVIRDPRREATPDASTENESSDSDEATSWSQSPPTQQRRLRMPSNSPPFQPGHVKQPLEVNGQPTRQENERHDRSESPRVRPVSPKSPGASEEDHDSATDSEEPPQAEVGNLLSGSLDHVSASAESAQVQSSGCQSSHHSVSTSSRAPASADAKTLQVERTPYPGKGSLFRATGSPSTVWRMNEDVDPMPSTFIPGTFNEAMLGYMSKVKNVDEPAAAESIGEQIVVSSGTSPNVEIIRSQEDLGDSAKFTKQAEIERSRYSPPHSQQATQAISDTRLFDEDNRAAGSEPSLALATVEKDLGNSRRSAQRPSPGRVDDQESEGRKRPCGDDIRGPRVKRQKGRETVDVEAVDPISALTPESLTAPRRSSILPSTEHDTKRQSASSSAEVESASDIPVLSPVYRGPKRATAGFQRESSTPITSVSTYEGQPDDLGALFSRYTATYPEYKGNLVTFAKSVSMLRKLEAAGQALYPSLYDDLIFHHCHSYPPYLLEEGLDNLAGPLSFHEFYRERIVPSHLKGVVRSATVHRNPGRKSTTSARSNVLSRERQALAHNNVVSAGARVSRVHMTVPADSAVAGCEVDDADNESSHTDDVVEQWRNEVSGLASPILGTPNFHREPSNVPELDLSARDEGTSRLSSESRESRQHMTKKACGPIKRVPASTPGMKKNALSTSRPVGNSGGQPARAPAQPARPAVVAGAVRKQTPQPGAIALSRNWWRDPDTPVKKFDREVARLRCERMGSGNKKHTGRLGSGGIDIFSWRN